MLGNLTGWHMIVILAVVVLPVLVIAGFAWFGARVYRRRRELAAAEADGRIDALERRVRDLEDDRPA